MMSNITQIKHHPVLAYGTAGGRRQKRKKTVASLLTTDCFRKKSSSRLPEQTEVHPSIPPIPWTAACTPGIWVVPSSHYLSIFSSILNSALKTDLNFVPAPAFVLEVLTSVNFKRTCEHKQD